MKSIRAISILGSTSLILSGCTNAIFSTDGGCGVIVPDDVNPAIYATLGGPDEIPSVRTDLSWQLINVPDGSGEVFSGAVTTYPLSDLVSGEIYGAPFAPSNAESLEYHLPLFDADNALSLATLDVDRDRYEALGHEIINAEITGGLPIGGAAGNLIFSMLGHFPVTLLASCGNDYRPTLEAAIDAAVDQDLVETPDIFAELTSTSAETVYPGFRPDLLDFQLAPDGMSFEIRSTESGWLPQATSISVWSESLLGPLVDQSRPPLSAMTEDWASQLILLDSTLFINGIGAGEVEQPVVWASPIGSEGEDPNVQLIDEGSLRIELNQRLDFDSYGRALNEDFQMQDPGSFEHFLLYTSFVKYPEDGSDEPPQLAYSFKRLNANQNGELTDFGISSGPIQISQVIDADPHGEIVAALFEDQGIVDEPRINGLDATEYAGMADFERTLHENFGAFSSGSDLIGLEQGLVMVPGYNPESMLLGAQPEQSEFFSPTIESDTSYYTGAGETLSTGADFYENSVVGALAASMDRDLQGFEPIFGPQGGDFEIQTDDASGPPVVDATTFSFKLSPSAGFFKMDFVLGMTEYGEWDQETGKWTNYISTFPDGLGIFVKSESQSWLDAVNCAAVPTTNTYLSMPAAGILPPGNPNENAELAAANYLELVRQTAVPGYSLSPNATIGFNLSEPIGEMIPPPMIALATERDSAVRYVTTPMTCVVDISEVRIGDEQIEVGLAVANLLDPVFPPAMFVSNGSIRFAQNAVATREFQEEALIEIVAQEEDAIAAAAPYTGPVVSTNLVSAVPGGEVILQGSGLATVTAVEIDGQRISVESATESSITFTLPLDTSAGLKDVTLISDSGRLLLAGLIRVGSNSPGIASAEPVASIKRIGNQARVFATDVIGAGKVQFFVDGREVAWIRAIDETDPKLFFANDSYYLVRRIELGEGKNVFEIFVDGERVRRVAYTLR